MLAHPALDHAIVAAGHHAGRIRIVRNDELEHARADLQLLFPHATILETRLGCCHTCLYTDDAPASLIGDCIEAHARDFDHATGEPRRKEAAPEGLGKQAAFM